ncbi:MAG: glycosyltransferase [Gemmatimonadaceae bacterium]|nr:glycosyltransferase [Gemmatimonadaceae bacterium]
MAETRAFIDRLTRPESELPVIHIGRDPLPPRLRPSSSLGVLDITEWFGDTSGGIRTYLLQKAQYVAARPGLRQVLAVPGARDAITEQDGVRLYRLQGPPIPRQKPYRFMLATKSVAKIVRHERPDIIEIGSPFIVPWIVRHATRTLDVPLVCFYHTNLPRMFAPNARYHSAARRAVFRASWTYMRRLDRMFPLTIVTSDFSAKDLAQEGITRVAKVPLGVDLERFSPTRRVHADATRRRFGLPGGPLAGFVGRFAREKELEMVLDAWMEVERRTGARLVLVGAGPLEAALRAHRYGSRVHFVPFQSDRSTLADVLAAFDLYLAPGRIETFGLSSLEALASGTPVLSADEGGVSEQVRSSGAGRTFVSGEAASLAEEAVSMFGDDLSALGRRGRVYAEREHAWDSVFDRLFEVYRTVLRGRPSPKVPMAVER